MKIAMSSAAAKPNIAATCADKRKKASPPSRTMTGMVASAVLSTALFIGS